jgi:hypothetical protein
MAGLTQLRATNFWKKLESLSTFEPFPTLKVFRFHVPSLQVHGRVGTPLNLHDTRVGKGKAKGPTTGAIPSVKRCVKP